MDPQGLGAFLDRILGGLTKIADKHSRELDIAAAAHAELRTKLFHTDVLAAVALGVALVALTMTVIK